MGIKNLTEAEEKEFYRLVGKMNGKEPDKEQDAKVKKPRQSEEYFYINDDGAIIQSRWTNDSLDNGRWELGNVFFTKESAWFAREKKKIKTELQRFADKYNDPEKEAWNNDNGHYMIAFNHRVNDLFITRGYYIEEESATYSFTSDSIARDAIEAVGKERILKYIFGGGKRKMPVARCKYCNNWLFNEDVGREYIQINSDMKIQSKFICLKCEMELRKEDFFEPYRSMMK